MEELIGLRLFICRCERIYMRPWWDPSSFLIQCECGRNWQVNIRDKRKEFKKNLEINIKQVWVPGKRVAVSEGV